MVLEDIPSLALGIIMSCYWLYVGRMILRVRRAARIRSVLIPTQRREQLMWIVWLPLIAAWIEVPFLAAWPPLRHNPWIGLSDLTMSIPAFTTVRFAAAAFAVLCLALSIHCWRYMGTHWRMGVDPEESTLFVDGPFALVRHPIYALSITLMICTVVVLPSPVMLTVGAVHILLMHLKARNEERFLRDRHSAAYEDYCRRTGRFLPLPGPGWRVICRRR